MPPIQTGVHTLLATPKEYITGKRIGLLVNQTSVAADGLSSIHHFHNHSDYQLIKLFAPEHGLFGIDQDMAVIRDEVEPSTRIPVVSLYGNSVSSLTPNPSALDGIDTLIFDIQDVGSRYYTFVNTLANSMKICGKTGTTVVVCDRPNPINGVHVEGNLVDAKYRSFVGQFPIPNRHGMTVGELAKLFQKAFGISCDLKIAPMQGWKRELWFDQTGLPWIAPSPNIPTLNTAIVYPGMCLLEGTHLSEGRGTTQPFEIFGAPYIEPDFLANDLNQEKLPGVFFRPQYFKPMFQKWADEVCGGIQIWVTDREIFKPVLTSIAILRDAYQRYTNSFQWRSEAYEFVSDRPAIDLLYGNSQFRETLIQKSDPLWDIEASWEDDLKSFKKLRKEFLIY